MIQTALGPVEARELGPASMHEHLLIDARILHAPSREPAPADGRVSLETLGFVRWNLLALEDNLVLDDADLAARELAAVAEHGQAAVVDQTCWGLGARPGALPAIARATGLHVVAGVGAYLDRPHPPQVAGDEAAVAARFVEALEVDYDGAGFRAGLIGLIGTSEPMTASERKVLRAAGRAAAQTGACVSVRLDPAARRGAWVIDELAATGCPPERVLLANVDEYADAPYLLQLAATGATLEWDFGNEAYYRDGYKDPTDAERLVGLTAVLDAGAVDRCVLGCSVWTKSQLRAYGGWGYDHLGRRILPELRRRGVGDAALTTMLTDTPRRLLDRP